MPIAAYPLRQWNLTTGLDRRGANELWHIVGITGWTNANTVDSVLDMSGIPLDGAAHPDPRLAGAVVTSRTLRESWLNQDGLTQEALVAITYDSDRRWGRGGFLSSSIVPVGSGTILVPNYVKVTNPGAGDDYYYAPFFTERAMVRLLEPRDATGITPNQKAIIISQCVGRLIVLGGVVYLIENPRIVTLPTNQTILTYSFMHKGSVPEFAANSTTIGIAIPALGILDEYQDIRQGQGGTPSIQVLTATQAYIRPTRPVISALDLPYWNAGLIPP